MEAENCDPSKHEHKDVFDIYNNMNNIYLFVVLPALLLDLVQIRAHEYGWF